MGTSSARRAPTGRLWRLAKGAATRYLSPESGGAVDAREVAARYLAALSEGGGPEVSGALATFRLTRKVAQNLGAFWSQTILQSWPAALSAWGLTDLAGAEPETRAQSLSAALEAPGGGLEQAVAHAALMATFLNFPAPAYSGPPPEAPRLVRRFLSAACHLRLALDLGESLEAAASGFAPLHDGLRKIGAALDRAAEMAGPVAVAPPLTPEHWLGLPGWTWVTTVLAGLFRQFSGSEPAQDAEEKSSS